jgi:heme exporter protein D
MKNVNYIWLIFPVSILIAGFMVLSVNLNNQKLRDREDKRQVAINAARQGATFHTEKAFPFFLLASAFILLILVLPRLQELSISERSLVLKLVSEVKEETAQLEEEVPLGQEALKTARTNDKLIRIKEKTALIEQLLKRGKS